MSDSWRDHAACLGTPPHLFFDDDIEELESIANRRCQTCPVRTACFADEMEMERGLVAAEVVTIKTRDEGLELLRQGQVDGLASDRTTLIGVAVKGASGNAYKLLEEDFSIEQYALMMPRGDPDFRLAGNRVLARLYRSGDLRRVYDRWLGPLGPPSPLLSATYFIQGLAE